MHNLERYQEKGFEVLRGKEVLHQLEKEGKYVFHGSARDIKILEPRQSFSKNPQTGVSEKIGDPLVYTTPYADIAIFMAIAHPDNVDQKYAAKFSATQKGNLPIDINFEISNDTKEQIIKNNIEGRVYVFKKEDFQISDEIGVEYVSNKPMTPIQTVSVSIQDLPNFQEYKTK